MTKGKGERVMVVDDERSVVDMVAQYLTLEGFQATRCYSGKEALLALKTERPDVIVLDLMMPDLDGMEVLEVVKKDKNLRNLTVILLTAKTSEQDQLAGWKKGAAFYITKPFELDELVNAIALALEERRRQIMEQKIYEIE